MAATALAPAPAPCGSFAATMPGGTPRARWYCGVRASHSPVAVVACTTRPAARHSLRRSVKTPAHCALLRLKEFATEAPPSAPPSRVTCATRLWCSVARSEAAAIRAAAAAAETAAIGAAAAAAEADAIQGSERAPKFDK